MKDKKNNVYSKLANWVCYKLDIDKNENAPYLAYFFDVFLFQIYETIIILSTAHRFGLLIEVLLCMLGFSIGRLTSRGRHMATKLGCLITSLVSFMTIAYIASITHWSIALISGLIFGFLMRKNEN